MLPPSEFNRYFEPFLGGGALFFHLVSSSAKHKRPIAGTAYISDINSELINSYMVVKDNVEQLIKLLKIHKIEYEKDPSDYYYNLRSRHKLTDSTEGHTNLLPLIGLVLMAFTESIEMACLTFQWDNTRIRLSVIAAI